VVGQAGDPQGLHPPEERGRVTFVVERQREAMLQGIGE
jgi:hypothetical protein